MALSILNNSNLLNAQNNLTQTKSSLNTSLQRLSSGLKINSAADGPAALVIAQEDTSQLTGINAAISNTAKATNVAQIADGALGQIDNLLQQIRGLSVDSANTGVDDTTALAANQQQINNALSTITQIAQTTQFGAQHLLDGSAAGPSVLGGDTSGIQASSLNASGLPSTLSSVVSQISAGSQGLGAVASGDRVNGNQGAGAATAGTVTITQVGNSTITVGITAGETVAGLAASLGAASNGAYSFGVSAGSSTGAAGGVATAQSLGVASNKLLNSAINLTFNSAGNAAAFGYSAAGPVGGIATAGHALGITATASNGDTLTSAVAAGTSNVTLTDTTAGGTLSYSLGTTGAVFNSGTIGAVSQTQTAVALTQGSISLSGAALNFQIGANSTEEGSGNTTSLSLASAKSTALAVNTGTVTVAGQSLTLNNSATTSLSAITVQGGNGFTAQQNSEDAISVVDAAIAQVNTQRAAVGAFQSETLQAANNNLNVSLTNTTGALGTTENADFAEETANYTQQNVLLQAGTQVLKTAESSNQVVLTLLQGL